MSSPAKIVTLTATPSASESAATAKSPGDRRSERRACGTSWRSVSIGPLDSGQGTGDSEWCSRRALRAPTGALVPGFRHRFECPDATLFAWEASQDVKRRHEPGGANVVGTI